MRKTALFIGICVTAWLGCRGNRRSITPHCHLQKDTQGYSLIMDSEDIQDTITQVSRIGWQGNWVYVWGHHARSRRKGWLHIWDNVVLKYHGPIAEEQSYYGRKNAPEYTAEEAWEKLK